MTKELNEMKSVDQTILYLAKYGSFKQQNGRQSDWPEQDVIGKRWSTLIPKNIKDVSVWKQLRFYCVPIYVIETNAYLTASVTSKKSPNVYKSCPKMISLEK